MRQACFAIILAPVLSACATVSFAPPPVNLTNSVGVAGDSACRFTEGNARVDQADSVGSTLALINNYALVYRCASHQAANGRQMFQIPSFLAALTGIAASTFGAGDNVPLAAGMTAATMNSANSYWAPTEKAVAIDAALDAVLCIRNEAVEIPFVETSDAPAALADGNEVSVTAAVRYHTLVSTSLYQVERILAKRLRTAGNFDPAGLSAELELLVKKRNDADGAGTGGEVDVPGTEGTTDEGGEGAGDVEAGDGDGDGDSGPEAIDGSDDDRGGTNKAVTQGDGRGGKNAPVRADDGEDGTRTGVYKINIMRISPRMQICVVRAKL